MKKVKVATIGYGHLGRWHAQKANQLENSELVAIVESVPENQKMAKEAYPNVLVVSDIKDVINEIDAAVIVTPTSTHFELTSYLLKNNKHVFCEKPLCSTFEQTLDLKKDIGNNIVQVGHSERCHEAWEKLEDEFNSIEGSKTIKLTRFAPFKGRATDVDVVQDLMIHDIDLMLYLFKKKPNKVSAFGHKVRTDKYDHATAHFYFEDGDHVIITSGRNHVEEVRSLEVMSSTGCLYVDLFTNEIKKGTGSQFEDGTYVKVEKYEKRDHLLIEQENFYHSIVNNSAPMVTYEDGVNAVYVVTKVLESIDSGKTIDLKYE